MPEGMKRSPETPLEKEAAAMNTLKFGLIGVREDLARRLGLMLHENNYLFSRLDYGSPAEDPQVLSQYDVLIVDNTESIEFDRACLTSLSEYRTANPDGIIVAIAESEDSCPGLRGIADAAVAFPCTPAKLWRVTNRCLASGELRKRVTDYQKEIWSVPVQA